jgi:hypothetical protein
VRDFIEEHHYSHSINGIKSTYSFGLFDGKEMVGAAIFGGIAMANVWKKYGDKREDVIELRRLVCIDDTPKNTESWFIARMLKWLVNNSEYKVVISYADDYYGHDGTIYKATNFKYLGTTSPSKMIEWNGRLWHDKTIRTKYRGQLKPYAQRVKDALDAGEARYIDSNFKYIYVYDLYSRREGKRLRSERGSLLSVTNAPREEDKNSKA